MTGGTPGTNRRKVSSRRAPEPFDVHLLAEATARWIRAGGDDAALLWSPDRRAVRVLLDRLIPSAGARHTFEARRRRFNALLRALLPEWERRGVRWVRRD